MGRPDRTSLVNGRDSREAVQEVPMVNFSKPNLPRNHSASNMRIAVIGAGLGGIATAVYLKKAGFSDFVIFERSSGPGGTWWQNTYPGCAVDIPSRAYSYSFMSRYDWKSVFARQPELQKYTEDVIDDYGIRDHLRFSTPVDRVEWDDAEQHYNVSFDGKVEAFDIVVAAMGMFSEPRFPDWPGMEEFEGPLFHTAQWEHEHDLSGKVVAVVGTGSTAAQVIPALAPSVEHLYVYQRQPGWVMPKDEHTYTPEEREKYRRRPLLAKWERVKFFIEERKLQSQAFEVGSRENRKWHRISLGLIEDSIDDPDLQSAVTPDYPWGCKRVVIASDFYKGLNRDNVTMVPHAVEHLTPRGIVSADGEEREVDAVVMSTGFLPYRALEELPVVGPKGRSLQDIWSDDPRAFLGMTVSGLPNFFLLYGPNTNGPTVIGMLEQQARLVARVAKRMRRRKLRLVDTSEADMERWVSWIDGRNHKQQSAGFTECTNYYFSPSGRNVTQWPSSWLQYTVLLRLLSHRIGRAR